MGNIDEKNTQGSRIATVDNLNQMQHSQQGKLLAKVDSIDLQMNQIVDEDSSGQLFTSQSKVKQQPSELQIEKELTADSTPEDNVIKQLHPPSQHSKSCCHLSNQRSQMDPDEEGECSSPTFNFNSNSNSNPDTNISEGNMNIKQEEAFSSQSAFSSDLFKQSISFGKVDNNDINIDIKNVFRTQRHQSVCVTSNSLKCKLNKNLIEDDDMSRSNSLISNSNADYFLNYYKTGEDMRKSYIAKLICKKVWTPSHKEKTHNTIIIFDWDDTLLCTTYLSPNGVFNENMVLTIPEKEKIGKLEACAFKLLSLAIEKGDVYIITNAGPGWVEYSTERFYPSLMPLLSKIKIVSARGEYESKYPGDSRMWKVQAFLKTRKSFNSELITNIICLGDSVLEMEAGHTLATKFTEAVFKTVKFRANPKPEELLKQLTLVATQFNSIYTSPKNLSIRVERKGK